MEARTTVVHTCLKNLQCKEALLCCVSLVGKGGVGSQQSGFATDSRYLYINKIVHSSFIIFDTMLIISFAGIMTSTFPLRLLFLFYNLHKLLFHHSPNKWQLLTVTTCTFITWLTESAWRASRSCGDCILWARSLTTVETPAGSELTAWHTAWIEFGSSSTFRGLVDFSVKGMNQLVINQKVISLMEHQEVLIHQCYYICDYSINNTSLTVPTLIFAASISCQLSLF